MQTREVEAQLRKSGQRDSAHIDLPTVDLLVHRGVDPLAVAWLVWVDEGLTVHDEDLDAVIEFTGEDFGAVSDLGQINAGEPINPARFGKTPRGAAMIAISDVAITRAIHAANRGEDPLGIGDDPLDRRLRAKVLCEESLDGVDGACARRLGEAIATKLANGRMGGNPHGVMPVDALMARMMAAAGIDPLPAVWIALQSGLLELDDETTGRIGGKLDATCAADDPTNASMCVIGRRSIWTQMGSLVVRDLPETLAMAAAGRRLRDVASHGVLDAAPLTIVAVDALGEGHGHGIRTDHAVRPASIDELVAAAPHGCR